VAARFAFPAVLGEGVERLDSVPVRVRRRPARAVGEEGSAAVGDQARRPAAYQDDPVRQGAGACCSPGEELAYCQR
jgi:hypothetical protein